MKFLITLIFSYTTSYYLNHGSIGKIAKLFYKGEFAVADDDATFSIVDSVLTRNKDTQPFYIFFSIN